MNTGKTVYTFDQLKALLPIDTVAGLKSFLQRAKKDGRLLNPRKGVWTLPVYSMKELAGALFPGGYLSLEPVLFEAGVSFQYYGSSIKCIWHKNTELRFNDQDYSTHSIKSSIRMNPLCIQQLDGYRQAMPERALCDLVYLRPEAHFDNPQYFQNPQSDARLSKLLPLYPKTTQRYVNTIITQHI